MVVVVVLVDVVVEVLLDVVLDGIVVVGGAEVVLAEGTDVAGSVGGALVVVAGVPAGVSGRSITGGRAMGAPSPLSDVHADATIAVPNSTRVAHRPDMARR